METLIGLDLPPGLSSNGTKYQNRNRWIDGSLVRFHEGSIRPVGGWLINRTDAGADLHVVGAPRGSLGWRDNSSAAWIAVGTTGTPSKLYALKNGVLTDITPGGLVVGGVDGGYACEPRARLARLPPVIGRRPFATNLRLPMLRPLCFAAAAPARFCLHTVTEIRCSYSATTVCAGIVPPSSTTITSKRSLENRCFTRDSRLRRRYSGRLNVGMMTEKVRDSACFAPVIDCMLPSVLNNK